MVWVTCVTGGGVDYVSGPYTVTFPAGQTRATFNVPITDDNISEGNENFILTINSSSLPTGVTVGDPGQATVTIVDDDGKQSLVLSVIKNKKLGIQQLFIKSSFQITWM